MTIKTWPEAERPREKLLARGAKALSDAELLAILWVVVSEDHSRGIVVQRAFDNLTGIHAGAVDRAPK